MLYKTMSKALYGGKSGSTECSEYAQQMLEKMLSGKRYAQFRSSNLRVVEVQKQGNFTTVIVQVGIGVAAGNLMAFVSKRMPTDRYRENYGITRAIKNGLENLLQHSPRK